MAKRKDDIIIEVNDNNFKDKVIEKSKEVPVVVDFWAEWCMPCLMLSPILEQIAEEYDGKFILAKLNVDDNKKSAEFYGITSIPSVKMFKNGEIVAEFVGAIPEDTIKRWLNENL